MNTPNRTTHIRLTSHPEPGTAATRFPIRWDAADPRERGPVIGSVTNPADRNVIGAHGGAYSLYRALAISARALNPLARPDLRNTHPVVEHRPAPAMVRARPHRLARSVGPQGRRGLRRRDRHRHRHPPVDRRHQGAAQHAGDPRRHEPPPAQGGRRHPAQVGRRLGHQDRRRSGLAPAGRRRALRRQRAPPPPHLVRADRRHVPGARHARRHAGVPAADRRHHRLYRRRPGGARRSEAHGRLPRARRMQRLRRVRLRHLHLPALPRARHRGMREGGAERRRRHRRL